MSSIVKTVLDVILGRPQPHPQRRHRLLLVCLLVLAVVSGGCAGDAVPVVSAHRHDAQGESCFICDPSKRDEGRLWCSEHARYEDRCWECQPQLREAGRLYCDEHGLYEDECHLCDQARLRTASDGEAKANASSSAHEPPELFCAEHQVPEHQCGVCQPQLAASLIPGASLLVRLPSARSTELMGLKMGTPSQPDEHSAVSLLGEIRFDGNRMVRVTPLASGVVAAVRVDVGEEVRAGQVLATVNSPHVAEAKARYLTARHDEGLAASVLQRKRALSDEGIGSQRALDEATVAHASAVVAASLARQGLLNLGFRERDVAGLGDDASSAVHLRAPFAGTVVSRTAVLGSAVHSGDPLLEIADLDEMWVELSVPEEAIVGVRVGNEVEVRVRSSSEAPARGTISWVGPVLDERTRLVRARAVVPNAERYLREGMFAEVSTALERPHGALQLPSSAVHRVGDLPFVFVKQEEDLFEARRVELGERLANDKLVVNDGLQAGEAVVMEGGFTLKSALLASRLGAGCTDD